MIAIMRFYLNAELDFMAAVVLVLVGKAMQGNRFYGTVVFEHL